MASSLSLLQTSWKKIPQDVRRTIASLLGPPSWEEEVKKQIVCENSRVYFTPAGAQLMLRGAAFGSQVRLKNPDVDYFWSEQSHRGWQLLFRSAYKNDPAVFLVSELVKSIYVLGFQGFEAYRLLEERRHRATTLKELETLLSEGPEAWRKDVRQGLFFQEKEILMTPETLDLFLRVVPLGLRWFLEIEPLHDDSQDLCQRHLFGDDPSKVILVYPKYKDDGAMFDASTCLDAFSGDQTRKEKKRAMRRLIAQGLLRPKPGPTLREWALIDAKLLPKRAVEQEAAEQEAAEQEAVEQEAVEQEAVEQEAVEQEAFEQVAQVVDEEIASANEQARRERLIRRQNLERKPDLVPPPAAPAPVLDEDLPKSRKMSRRERQAQRRLAASRAKNAQLLSAQEEAFWRDCAPGFRPEVTDPTRSFPFVEPVQEASVELTSQTSGEIKVKRQHLHPAVIKQLFYAEDPQA